MLAISKSYLIVILSLQITSISSYPLHMPFLRSIIEAQPQIMMHTLQQPIPIDTLEHHLKTQSLEKQTYIKEMQSQLQNMEEPIVMPTMQDDMIQQIALQQQILALQQLQGLNAVHSPMGWPTPQPVLIFLPDDKMDSADENHFFKQNNKNHHEDDDSKQDQGYEDDDLDSVVIEQPTNAKKGMRKAILLIPNARISIGGIISTIPWLPFEVNVPDTIAWAWNGITSGISGIISIIGSRLPFIQRPQSANMQMQPSVKMFLKQLQRNTYNPTIPIYILPLGEVLPMQNFEPNM